MLCVVDERKARLIIHRTVYASAVICAVSVCQSVRTVCVCGTVPVASWSSIDWSDRAGFLTFCMKAPFDLSYSVLNTYNEIQVSTKIRVLLSGTLS